MVLMPVDNDTTQLNSTSSWVELCRYKHPFTVFLFCGGLPLSSFKCIINAIVVLKELNALVLQS